jgi:hypothetical protein
LQRIFEKPECLIEDIAKRVKKERDIVEGSICVISCVEPCTEIRIYCNSSTKKLEKCTLDRKSESAPIQLYI